MSFRKTDPHSSNEGSTLAWAALLTAIFFVAVLPARAQNRATVSVDLSKAVNVLTDTSLGAPAVTSDANSFSIEGVPYLRAAGITALRYPGNHGVADLYHWSTKSMTPYHGADPGYIANESSFPNLARLAEQLGQAVIVVNYGGNFDGTGGAEPAEAAAWVAYANGNPSDTHAIGKDSTGRDWQTTGYWASLRSQAPLENDDGFNFLRIQHPRPFDFKLWQIGDDVYNNGYYGDHTGTPDLHGPAPASPKDLAKLKGNPNLSPEAYARNLILFAQAMKAVDPSIQIGAAITTPPDPELRKATYWDSTGEHPDLHAWTSAAWGVGWNRDLLKGACSSLDFVTLEWTQSPLAPPDYKALDEAVLLGVPQPGQTQVGNSSTAQFKIIVDGMLADYASYCPKGRVLPLAFAPAGISPWLKVQHPIVKALWIADFYATLIESGSINVNWNEMYGDSMLSADRKKFGPAFYGLQMLHTIAHAPGDLLLDAKSNSLSVAAHATYRRDGYFGLMLVNKDPKLSAIVKVSFKNGTTGSAGRRIDYGATQFAAGDRAAVSAFSIAGGEFEVTVPPYTITDILLPNR